MSNHKYILENFQNYIDSYIYEDWEDVVVKFTREDDELRCYAKQKGGTPYLIDWENNLIMNTRISGQIVDKTFYEDF